MSALLQQNLAEIRANIEKAALKSGRRPQDITLLAVTKTIPAETIRTALALGVTCFGENKVQELLPKYESLGPAARWHMIGHLQTNKVKYIIDKVKLIHSVDSLRLAEAINKHAIRHNLCADVLVEINVANEASKHGVSASDLRPLLEKISILPNLRVLGLMTLPPFVENGEENRFFFAKMCKIAIDIRAWSLHNVNMDYLSMGTTTDYVQAIEEGANMVRIGAGLFGAR